MKRFGKANKVFKESNPTFKHLLYNPTKRLPIVLTLAVFLFCAVFVKMAYVIVVQGESLQAKAIDEWMRDVPTDAPRGVIYDRNMLPLASTATKYTLYVRPSDAQDKPAIAQLFADVFGYDYEATLKKISKRTSEVTIAKAVSKEQLSAVYSSGLKGIYYAENNYRYYPYGDFMTQVLGFCSSDGYGQTGLEAFYDKYLTGIDGQILTESDLVGRAYSGAGSFYMPSISGLNLVTTLDKGIQQIVDGAVRNAVAKYDPKGVYCVVMDYDTGGILALSEYPSFDLNNVPRDDLQTLFAYSKSMAVSSVYEPGSTFKILTAASAIDAGVVSVNDRFYCAGSRVVDGKKIRCWKSKGHGSIDFAQGVEQSCNCVFMDSALRLGTPTFYEYLRNFGLTKKTGIDMTGETSGIFIAENAVKTVDLARIGFGQAVAVTPIGLISATSSVVNGGNKVVPHLLNYLSDSVGNKIGGDERLTNVRTVSASTSEIMRELLTRVVENGSGKGAYVPGYKIAGKTGTAQKYENGQIARGKYYSSFLGFSLNEGARFAVLFIVDEPKGYMYYGSLVAAPLVGDIFESSLAYLGVNPTYSGKEAELVGEPFELPSFVGLSVTEAKRQIEKLGLYCEVDGEGNSVLDQYPVASATVDRRNVVLIVT